MTTEAKAILFVCTGNIGRSPMAQYMAERLAREAGLPWRFFSAGTHAAVGLGLESGAVRALAARGLTGLRHAARPLDDGLLAKADAVYALTRAHAREIAARFPPHAAKVAVLREAAGLPGVDVADPYGLDDAAYAQCAARIEEALKILIRRLSHVEDDR